ncbi:MAG: nitronate monooxygenase [Firmicutes bacterium]|nr:nitronate monooxygenase [Bacillota bacterium]
MFKTRITELLGIEVPIIQGGLAYLARAELCAAVSRAGGLGQITAATLPSPEALKAEIERVRQLTDRPFAVNFAMGHRPLEPYIDAALEAGVRIVTITGGNPEPYMRYIDQRVPGVKKLVLVASVRTAQKAEALGADAVIAVGFDGGGHLGREDIGTMALIPRVVDAVKIPVVASGGIADGRGLVAALALGAEGIEMGTRFVAVAECPAHPAYKEALVRAEAADTVIVERSIGRPARVLQSGGARRILEAESRGATLEELLPLISGQVNARAALEGELEDGFVYAGQGVGLIRDVPTVAELFDRILAEARAAAARLRPLLPFS